ncbi:VGLL2 protein, partial [Polypterus senegalus]|nr:VGLL2 protein [Polypterus senegalus]
MRPRDTKETVKLEGLESDQSRTKLIKFLENNQKMQKNTEGLLSSLCSPSFPGMNNDGQDKEKQEATEAKYLNSRCVLLTYYHGDISSVVDEHFSRALSNYTEEDKKKCDTEHGADSSSSRSKRCFPPSFWDSTYNSPANRSHHGGPPYSVDMYHSAIHPAFSQPHQPESWSYSQNPSYPHPRPFHELYRPEGLETHYASLLVPASHTNRLPAIPGHYDISKLDPASTWPGLLPTSDIAQTFNIDTSTSMLRQLQ